MSGEFLAWASIFVNQRRQSQFQQQLCAANSECGAEGEGSTHNLGLFLGALVEAAEGIFETCRQSPQGLVVGLPGHGDDVWRARGTRGSIVSGGGKQFWTIVGGLRRPRRSGDLKGARRCKFSGWW